MCVICKFTAQVQRGSDGRFVVRESRIEEWTEVLVRAPGVGCGLVWS